MYSKRRYYFLTLAKHRNISKAAEELMVSQPSLTQYINKLEEELGIKLFDRNFTPLRLTEAGETYHMYLKESWERDQAFLERLDEIRKKNSNPLRIGVPMQKQKELSSILLPEFLSSNPNVSVHVWEGTSISVCEKVRKGIVDIGFAHILNIEEFPFEAKLVKKERIVLICNRKNPLAQGLVSDLKVTSPVDITALKSQLFYEMAPEYYLFEVSKMYMDHYGVKPEKKIVMSSLRAIINIIASKENTGYALIPDYIFDDMNLEALSDKLTFMRLGEEDIYWDFVMFKKKGMKLSKEARLFWNIL